MKTVILNDIYSLDWRMLLLLSIVPIVGAIDTFRVTSIPIYAVFFLFCIILDFIRETHEVNCQLLMSMPISRKDYIKAKFAEITAVNVYILFGTNVIGLLLDVIIEKEMFSRREAATVLLNTLVIVCVMMIFFGIFLAVYFMTGSLFWSGITVFGLIAGIVLPVVFVLIGVYCDEPSMYNLMSTPVYIILPITAVAATIVMYFISCRAFEESDL